LPLIVTFDYLTRQVNRITGGRGEIESTYVTREEIRDIIETGERAGVLARGAAGRRDTPRRTARRP
jgi:hypothetical protein